MDRRRPLLVNEGEFRTDAALREAAAALGYGVHAKVRVADALRIDGSGISDDEYGYALRAHFDWLVTDVETTKAEFAVEFDGASHDGEPARRRDAMKDAICERLELPLLRLDRFAFRPTIRRSILWYLVESWSLWRAFDDAQERGQIPLDEVFEPWAFIDGVDENRNPIFRDLARATRLLVGRMFYRGELLEPIATHMYRGGRPDDPDHAEGWAWVSLPDASAVIVGHARIRAYSFPAVLDFDLADDLAHIDLGGKLMRLTEGDRSVLQDPASAPRFVTGWSGGGGGGAPVDEPAA
jgi:hypothetical protein